MPRGRNATERLCRHTLGLRISVRVRIRVRARFTVRVRVRVRVSHLIKMTFLHIYHGLALRPLPSEGTTNEKNLLEEFFFMKKIY